MDDRHGVDEGVKVEAERKKRERDYL